MRHARKSEKPFCGIYIFLSALFMIFLISHYSYQLLTKAMAKDTQQICVKTPTPAGEMNSDEKSASQDVSAKNKSDGKGPGTTKGTSTVNDSNATKLNTTSKSVTHNIGQPLAMNEMNHVNTTLQVTTPIGNIRSGPGLNQKVVGTLRKDSILFANIMVTQGKNIWYHIHSEDGTGWISDKIVKYFTPPKDGILLNAPLISQMPELQRGCEVTSLAMLLNNSGINTTKMQLAKEVKKDPTPFQFENGYVHFGNPNTGFVGNIYNIKKPGLGVYHEPIFTLAKRYLGKRAIDITGKGFDAVTDQLNKHRPVWVILSSTFNVLPDSAWETWETPTGKVRITYREHSVLITGYDNDYIYFNDPLANEKNRRINRSHFIASWKQFGEQAISYN